jgi:hypothetical protein
MNFGRADPVRGSVLALAAVAILLPITISRVSRNAGVHTGPSVAADLSRHNASGNAKRPLQPRLVESYGRWPLSFEANHGQTDGQVKFLSRGRGYTMFLTQNEAVVTLRRPSVDAKGHDFSRAARRPPFSPLSKASPPEGLFPWKPDALFPVLIENPKSQMENRQTEAPGPEFQPSAVLCMRLVGANAKAKVIGLDELPGKSNYFVGNDPKKWRTNVPTYAKVKYKDIYPGIDLVYYGNQGRLEHDFVVSPGANPGTIKLAVDGADSLRLDDQGNLVAQFSSGDVVLDKPVVYQQAANLQSRVPNPEKLSIEGRYALLADNHISFDVGTYDPSQPLVMDPVLEYSTYLGGSGGDKGWSIAVGSSGNAYVTGETTSVDFPTAGALRPAIAGATTLSSPNSMLGGAAWFTRPIWVAAATMAARPSRWTPPGMLTSRGPPTPSTSQPRTLSGAHWLAIRTRSWRS